MKFIVIACALALVAMAVPEVSLREQFAVLRAKAGRAYGSDEVEAKHFAAFERNAKAVDEMNRANPHAAFALNLDNFDALPRARAVMPSASSVGKKRAHVDRAIEESSYPAVLDWRTKGAVGPVHNNAQCLGANPAFTVLDNVEGTYFVKNQLPNDEKMVHGSAEQLIDCATDEGCGAGISNEYYRWMLQSNNGEVATLERYPYRGGGHTCKKDQFPPAATITSFKAVGVMDETALTKYVASMGPIATAVYAAGQLEYYTSGIVTDCGRNGQPVDNGALIVGYDDTHNPPYWILKNTWGPQWGEEGFFRVEKGTNVCGIAEMPVTAIPAEEV